MRWLLGQEFTEVGGFISTLDKRDPDGKLIDLDDNAYLTLKTDSGVIGSMILSWTNYGAEENYTVLYCQKGVSRTRHRSRSTASSSTTATATANCTRSARCPPTSKQVASGIIDSFTAAILEEHAARRSTAWKGTGRST